MLIAGKRQSCLAHSCWLQIKKPLCRSAANAHGIWSGRRQGHLPACHLLAARTCAWCHGLDGDEDTCLHVTCRQQEHVHGIMVWTEMRTPVCMSPAGSKDMCMVSWFGGDEDTCLHVTYRQQGHVHGIMVWTEMRTPVCMSPTSSKEICMVSWSGRR